MIGAKVQRNSNSWHWCPLRIVLLCLAGLAILGCSKDTDNDPPAELVDLIPQIKVERLWSISLGGDAERLRLALRPEYHDGVVYAASHEGDVIAVNAENGRRIWTVRTKLPLSAGPGFGEGVLVLGSSDGDAVALDAATGAERWRKTVSSEVLARPLVANGVAVLRTVDGHVAALSLSDGAQRWVANESVPRLSLRGSAPPTLAGSVVVAAFDNGKVLGIDAASGDVLWDSVVNAPRGRTELERLADIDAPPRVAGQDVFVVGFQGRVTMLALDSGQIWWARDASSYRGFAMDDDNLYLTTSDSIVTSMRRRDGAVQWEQNALRRRGLSAPALDGGRLVVGDFEGYLHWLDKTNGEQLARIKADDERITNAPLTAEGRVFVQTDGGKLLAFGTGELSAKEMKRQPKPAAPESEPAKPDIETESGPQPQS